jgi:hypothetical protein
VGIAGSVFKGLILEKGDVAEGKLAIAAAGRSPLF